MEGLGCELSVLREPFQAWPGLSSPTFLFLTGSIPNFKGRCSQTPGWGSAHFPTLPRSPPLPGQLKLGLTHWASQGRPGRDWGSRTPGLSSGPSGPELSPLSAVRTVALPEHLPVTPAGKLRPRPGESLFKVSGEEMNSRPGLSVPLSLLKERTNLVLLHSRLCVREVGSGGLASKSQSPNGGLPEKSTLIGVSARHGWILTGEAPDGSPSLSPLGVPAREATRLSLQDSPAPRRPHNH